MTVFISHNKSDRNIARAVALDLVAENLSIWFDEWEICAGDSIVEQVEAGLVGCTHFLILWSRHAAKSNWVRRELNASLAHALQVGTPRLIPVLLDRTPLPPLLTDIKSIRYRHGREPERHELLRAIAGRDAFSELLRAVVRKYHELVRPPRGAIVAGYAACPKCGSREIEAWEDLEVDEEWADGAILQTPIFFPAVRCLDCGWSQREHEITMGGGV
jgi:hypothetical protein